MPFQDTRTLSIVNWRTVGGSYDREVEGNFSFLNLVYAFQLTLKQGFPLACQQSALESGMNTENIARVKMTVESCTGSMMSLLISALKLWLID